MATKVTRLNFDLQQVKLAAKKYNTTINGYILAKLFEIIASERDSREMFDPISVLMPIDCRSYLPNTTMRNFVTSKNMIMHETEDFTEKVKQINKQFAEIDPDTILNFIVAAQKVVRIIRFIPRSIKQFILKELYKISLKNITTTFSNIGLIKYPKEAEEYIDFMDFTLSQEGNPYSFGCISVGNTLTMTVTASVEGEDIVNELKARLERAV